METELQQHKPGAVKEKTQYVLTFGVIAAMLYVAQFPFLVIFFFGVFAYFLWKTFSRPTKQGIREIFEFYLSANEILRDDERRWFGFEVQEVINSGERIVTTMKGAPPLVYYALGALYHKSGNHRDAVEHLEFVVDNDRSDESTYVHPSGELRTYVRILRKIERDPVEAPQMSAAVRSLERARKNKVDSILDESRKMLAEIESANASRENPRLKEAGAESTEPTSSGTAFDKNGQRKDSIYSDTESSRRPGDPRRGRSMDGQSDPFDLHSNRKPISEVLHDIYDKNIQ